VVKCILCGLKRAVLRRCWPSTRSGSAGNQGLPRPPKVDCSVRHGIGGGEKYHIGGVYIARCDGAAGLADRAAIIDSEKPGSSASEAKLWRYPPRFGVNPAQAPRRSTELACRQ
jgi:hypothetical protein